MPEIACKYYAPCKCHGLYHRTEAGSVTALSTPSTLLVCRSTGTGSHEADMSGDCSLPSDGTAASALSSGKVVGRSAGYRHVHGVADFFGGVGP